MNISQLICQENQERPMMILAAALSIGRDRSIVAPSLVKVNVPLSETG
jgi:hypothetical protein